MQQLKFCVFQTTEEFSLKILSFQSAVFHGIYHSPPPPYRNNGLQDRKSLCAREPKSLQPLILTFESFHPKQTLLHILLLQWLFYYEAPKNNNWVTKRWHSHYAAPVIAIFPQDQEWTNVKGCPTSLRFTASSFVKVNGMSLAEILFCVRNIIYRSRCDQ